MRFNRPKVYGHFKPEYRLMSSVNFAWIFLIFIELQISDIASNTDAYERKLQRASYFQMKIVMSWQELKNQFLSFFVHRKLLGR